MFILLYISVFLSFLDPDILSEFTLTVCPDEGFWQGGKFRFDVVVTEEYNIAVGFHPKLCFNMCERY